MTKSEFVGIEEIPKEWEIIKLRDHTSKIGSGVTPLGGSQVYEKEGIPFIRSQNVHFDRLHLEDIVYITKKIQDEMSSTKLQPFDVLLNITGASIGRCNYVPPDFGEGNVNQHVCIIRTTQRLNPIFLAKFLSTPLMQDLIKSKQAGLSRQGLTFREIGNLYILCPPILEQQKIAAILSKVDHLIQKTEGIIEQTRWLKKGLIQRLFTTGVGHKRLKTVKLFPLYKHEQIPEGWTIAALKDVVQIIDYRGRTPPFSKEGIIHIRSNNIRNSKIVLDDVVYVSEKIYDEYMTRGIPKEDDVLFTTEGPLGEVALVPKN